MPIDLITSTSMGSIIGGAYACGHPAAMLDSVVRSQDWAIILSDRESSKNQSLQVREKHNTYFLTKILSLKKQQDSEGGGFIRSTSTSYPSPLPVWQPISWTTRNMSSTTAS